MIWSYQDPWQGLLHEAFLPISAVLHTLSGSTLIAGSTYQRQVWPTWPTSYMPVVLSCFWWNVWTRHRENLCPAKCWHNEQDGHRHEQGQRQGHRLPLSIFGSKTLYSFSEPLVELDKIIRRIIVESLGVEKYLEEHMKSTSYFLRVAKYQAPQTTEKFSGLKAHTDTNVLTILYQYQVDGFEIQTKDGDWIPSFLIILAESLNVNWSFPFSFLKLL